MSLLEHFAPNPDAAEFHQIEVRASPDVVYRALWTTDLGRSPIVKALLTLRSLPGIILSRGTGFARAELTLQTIIDAGFGLLSEQPGREVVLGVSGRFWRLAGNLEPFDPESFSRPVPPGMARAAWNFKVAPSDGQGTTLSTETRVTCGDAASRTKFRFYWLVVRPFSGLIRSIMLKAVQQAAQARAV
jgi:hypothetical protein